MREQRRPPAPVRAAALVLLAALVTAGCGAAGAGPAGRAAPVQEVDVGPEGTAPSTGPREADRTPDARTGPGDAAVAADGTGAPDAGTGTPRVGRLVEDFPVDLLPVPDDAVLLVTSAVPVGGSAAREVSLNLRTELSVDAVMGLYRDALTTAGFAEVTPPTDATGPTGDATFTRSGGDELVTIGVLDVDGARTVTLGGRVRAGGTD